MISLDGRYGRAISDIAEVALHADDAQQAWTHVMALFESTLGFDSGWIGTSAGPVAAAQGAILGHEERVVRNSLSPLCGQLGAKETAPYHDRACRSTDFWSTRRREELAVYYPPAGPRMTRQTLLRVSLFRGALLAVCLERRPRTNDYAEGQLEFVEAAWPLLQVVTLLNRTSERETLDFAGAWALTRRETEVAELLLRGLQNAEIGLVLGISRHTVRNTLARVFVKARVSTRSELVFTAHQLSARSLEEDGLTAFAKVVGSLATSRAIETVSQPNGRVLPPGLIYMPPQSGN